MGQQEVIELLEKKPRLCSREIAEELDWRLDRVCRLVSHLVNGQEVIASIPSNEELQRILEKYPHAINASLKIDAPNSIKVFEVL